MKATIIRLIPVYPNNIDFTLKIKAFLYKIAINYLLFQFFCAIYSSI